MTPSPVEAQLAELVERYCSDRRNPALPPFTIHPVQPWKGWWKSPQSYRPGCYLIYSADGTLMYLGKASLGSTMGTRIGFHEKDPHPKWTGAAHIQMVEVAEPFEAPSLEEYLLHHLRPPLNKLGTASRRLQSIIP